MPSGVYQRPSWFERFWKWVSVPSDATRCWLWKGALHHGYGYLRIDGREWESHRVSYLLHYGDLPPQLDHLCRVRHCANPYHLESVTAKENILRGESPSARNARKTHCPKRHPYNEENTYLCLRRRNNHPNKWSRECRICARERQLKYAERRKVA
jgi:hypothetical protein